MEKTSVEFVKATIAAIETAAPTECQVSYEYPGFFDVRTKTETFAFGLSDWEEATSWTWNTEDGKKGGAWALSAKATPEDVAKKFWSAIAVSA